MNTTITLYLNAEVSPAIIPVGCTLNVSGLPELPTCKANWCPFVDPNGVFVTGYAGMAEWWLYR
jgi:hypothetical protein